ncbi:LysR family transcriptional regulator [Vagococcus salmoninarum]|uniref:LysR family transcriptional regulator n=1 Tax=Vagococcus salmoninarum TaxID=2739 RepID=UPI00398AB36F
MNIQQLKYFIQIADSRNVSDAALSLFVTQPTLSLALKKMEGELNTKLFNHSDSPYQLTDTGLVI